jgi:hypothetical protein
MEYRVYIQDNAVCERKFRGRRKISRPTYLLPGPVAARGSLMRREYLTHARPQSPAGRAATPSTASGLTAAGQNRPWSASGRCPPGKRTLSRSCAPRTPTPSRGLPLPDSHPTPGPSRRRGSRPPTVRRPVCGQRARCRDLAERLSASPAGLGRLRPEVGRDRQVDQLGHCPGELVGHPAGERADDRLLDRA